jgi:CBS domain-containing protein
MQPAFTQQISIYIDEGDSQRGRTIVRQVLEALRSAGCPGATVLRGVGGFGVRGVIYNDLLMDAPSRLPLVITCIDRSDRIERVLPTLQTLVTEGLIVRTPVEVIHSSRREGAQFPRYLTVADVMTRDVIQVKPTTSVRDIFDLAVEHTVRALPVVNDQGVIVGIITDGDLLRRGATSLPMRLQQLLPRDTHKAEVALLATRPQHAAELMTPNPVTMPAATPIARAAALMAEQDLKRMPVVDAAGQLVGIVSRSDLLKTVAEGLYRQPEQPVRLATSAPATVGALMITAVPTVQPDTSLIATLDRLLETEKRRVVVVDADQHVVGIITDGDVLRRAARRVQGGALQRIAAWFSGGERPSELEVEAKGRTAADVMSSPVITVRPDTPTIEAIRLMMQHAVKRLPVVDTEGRLLGLIGRAAVLGALRDECEP